MSATGSSSRIALSLSPTCDEKLLWDTWMSIFHFPTLTCAEELGVFAALSQRPSTAQELSEALSLSTRAAEVMLGLLASLGYLVQLNGLFTLSETANNYLRPDSPYYYGGMLRLMSFNPVTHGALLEALKKDKPTVYDGQDIWEAHDMHPAQAEAFISGAHSQTLPPGMGAAQRIDFTNVKRILDVGGGSGAFSIALASRHPHLCCTVMDRPIVCSIAERYVANHGLSGQIDTHPADFFMDPWPVGYDGIVFSNIFHDWSRPRCQFLGRRSFEALPSGGRIFIHEILLNDTKDGPLAAAAFSMLLFWVTEGKQLTAAEVHGLLAEQGFVDIRVTPTYGYYSVVEARKP